MTAPISLTVAKGRTNNTFAVQFNHDEDHDVERRSRTRPTSAGLAGINYPTPPRIR